MPCIKRSGCSLLPCGGAETPVAADGVVAQVGDGPASRTVRAGFAAADWATNGDALRLSAA
jgi:hypothetical protein